MHATVAYLLAVATASAIIFLERLGIPLAYKTIVENWDAFGRFPDWIAATPATELALRVGIWFWVAIGLVSGALFVLFLVANIIAALPFAVFHRYYKRLEGGSAMIAAVIFGVLVAFAGMELVFGFMARFKNPDHLRVFGWSILPGIGSGWVFHATMKRLAVSPRNRTDQELVS